MLHTSRASYHGQIAARADARVPSLCPDSVLDSVLGMDDSHEVTSVDSTPDASTAGTRTAGTRTADDGTVNNGATFELARRASSFGTAAAQYAAHRPATQSTASGGSSHRSPDGPPPPGLPSPSPFST